MSVQKEILQLLLLLNICIFNVAKTIIHVRLLEISENICAPKSCCVDHVVHSNSMPSARSKYSKNKPLILSF